jgi:hypothetical protein
MIYSKKAQSGEAILMIFRLTLLMFIAFSIYFISGLNLDYHLDTKDVEANILGNLIFDCVSQEDKIVIEELPSKNNEISSYCKINGTEKTYTSINITKKEEEIFTTLENPQYKESIYLYNLGKIDFKATKKYKPGHSKIEREIDIVTEEKTISGIIKIEVIIENEI